MGDAQAFCIIITGKCTVTQRDLRSTTGLIIANCDTVFDTHSQINFISPV